MPKLQQVFETIQDIHSTISDILAFTTTVTMLLGSYQVKLSGLYSGSVYKKPRKKYIFNHDNNILWEGLGTEKSVDILQCHHSFDISRGNQW